MSPEAAKLRARFLRLVAIESAAIVLAIVFAVVYFAAHLGWALPAFVASLAAAAAAQIDFILRFNRTLKGGHP